MPFGSLDLTNSAGFWTFLGSVITVICLTFVRLLMILLIGKTNRDTSLSGREDKFFSHQADEISRLSAMVAGLDAALKNQAEFNRLEMQRERDDCNAKMLGLKGEIEILKQRITNEEQR